MMQDCCTFGEEFGQYNYPGAYCFPFASNYITPLIISMLFYYEGYFGRICQYIISPHFVGFAVLKSMYSVHMQVPYLNSSRNTYGIMHN